MSNAILTSSQYQNYRRIDLIVIHCSATRATQSYTVDDCRRDHRARGFADIGYHYYITRDGVVHAGRALYQVGAHATGYNRHSIGICYEGGLNARDRPADTRTPEQKETLQRLLERLKEDYPDARIVGNFSSKTLEFPAFSISKFMLTSTLLNHYTIDYNQNTNLKI